ncbi:MAG: glycosyltransferase family 1 protein [Candidatus Pacebacteria bacterium]|nr:glycosyltransferase family 1 protein [Candidatus Paceibacterota bacterium]
MQKESKPKTIGIDARMFGYAQTGIGNYIRHLLEYIFKIDHVNNYVVFLMPEEFDNFQVPNERVRKVMTTCKWYSWKEQLIFPFTLYKENLDLMHFTHFNSPILYGKKSIITIHDVTPYFFPGHKMKSPLRRWSFRLVFYSSVKKAKKIIAVSQSTKNDIIKYFKIKPGKIQVIYEGADEQFRILEDRIIVEDLRRKYGLRKPFLFYTGVWRNHKNLVGLIKAFKIVKEKYHLDIDLVLGGKEDPYYPEVRETWEKLGLQNNIIPVGFIDQTELPVFYNAADAFVIPSFYEGFGLIGLEAMSCGTPVISSDRTSLPEVLGKGAIYFDPDRPEKIAEKICLVFTDKNLYNELKRNGFLQIKKYSWNEMGKETLELYKKI